MNYDTHNRAEALAVVIGIVYCIAVILWETCQ